MLPRIAAAVPLSLCCCCACQCRSCLACCCCAWCSRITAAVPLLRCCCCAALTSLLPYRSRVAPAACGALASLLLWHSRSHCCCCGALAYHCCCAALAWLLHAVHGALASLLPCLSRLAAAAAFSSSPLAAAVHGALALMLPRPCDSCLASWCCGALASLLLWRSRIAAAVPLLRHGRHAKLASRLPCRSRTSLLPCRSHIAASAAVALSHRCMQLWRSRVAAAVWLLHS